jgi:hypothetical protein
MYGQNMEYLIYFMMGIICVSVPLGLWKLADIVLWLWDSFNYVG